MVPRLLAAARAMRSRTCADVIQPCSLSLFARSRGRLDERPWERRWLSRTRKMSSIRFRSHSGFLPKPRESTRFSVRGEDKQRATCLIENSLILGRVDIDKLI